MNDAARVVVRYTRCPVPTATGIAIDAGIFGELFADGPYDLRDIAELGQANAAAHYTHAIDYCFREGGCGPPIWARARGADTRLIGITFVEELLGIYVRADDTARSVTDLVGRRVAQPRWPALVFDFWRIAARKGLVSALSCHGLAPSDVQWVDIVETGAPDVASEADASARSCRYEAQLAALVADQVDAIFAKGAEAAVLEQVAGDHIRLLYDVASSPRLADRINNSTPRVITVGNALLRDHPEAVIRYLQGTLRAAAWAPLHRAQALAIIAGECRVAEADVLDCFELGLLDKLAPDFADPHVAAVSTMRAFLRECGALPADFAVERWVCAEPLAEARARERAADH